MSGTTGNGRRWDLVIALISGGGLTLLVAFLGFIAGIFSLQNIREYLSPSFYIVSRPDKLSFGAWGQGIDTSVKCDVGYIVLSGFCMQKDAHGYTAGRLYQHGRKDNRTFTCGFAQPDFFNLPVEAFKGHDIDVQTEAICYKGAGSVEIREQ
jgi:hypothetical protein